MSLINARLLHAIPEYLRKSAVYYPDILLFQHDRDQYLAHWHLLSQSKYIYTNGIVIRPANWFEYIFQSFTGWLGFSNHCQAQKVQLSLQKLAYFGYVSGYPQTYLASMNQNPIEPGFLKHVLKSRNNESTQYLQNQLLNQYIGNVASFNNNDLGNQLPRNHFFGLSWGRFSQWHEIPRLDPQNKYVISQTIEHLKTEYNQDTAYAFIRPSSYVNSITIFYLDKAKEEKQSRLYHWPNLSDSKRNTQYFLKMALYFSPDCYLTELPMFIDYFLEQKNHQKAYELISMLLDKTLALKYLTEQFSEQQQIDFVPKNSDLSQRLAAHYLKKGSSNIKTLQKASKFVDNIAAQSPAQAFILHVEEKEYDKAYEVFETYQDTVTFQKSSLKKLSDYFVGQGEKHYEEGHKYRQSQRWDKAKEGYLSSLIAMKKASLLTPTSEAKERGFAHQRLYAQLLIYSDKQTNHPSKSDVKSIQIAIKLLEECKPTTSGEQKLHVRALATGLMRYADYLTHQIAVPLLYSHDRDTEKAHKATHKPNFEKITSVLQRVIDLLKGTKKAELKLILGKAHFILGDMNYFFDLGEYKTHFKSAADTVPNNPYYNLRASAHFEKEKKIYETRGLANLKALGHTVFDYSHWDEQRWEQGGPVYGSIHTIHELEAPTKSGPKGYFGM